MALALTSARSEAERNIIDAERRSLQSVYEQAEQSGGLKVEFTEVAKGNGDIDPLINWSWTPFGNTVLKIHRNQGSIIEDIERLKISSELVFVEQTEASGAFQDRDANNGETYNYYVFLETRRQGFKAKNVTRNIPAEFGDGQVIDAEGREITRFNTVEPEAFEEALYFGFQCKRVTLEVPEDQLAQQRRELDTRRSSVELKKYEEKIVRMEEDLEIERSGLTEDTLASLLDRAKAKSARRKNVEELLASIEADPDLDAEEKEELTEEILHRIQ